ncbi:hypothetical protein ACJJIE_05705 [Microbulbifer sp. TRSA001]
MMGVQHIDSSPVLDIGVLDRQGASIDKPVAALGYSDIPDSSERNKST